MDPNEMFILARTNNKAQVGTQFPTLILLMVAKKDDK